MSDYQGFESIVDGIRGIERDFGVRVGVQTLMTADGFGTLHLIVRGMATRKGLFDVPGYMYYPCQVVREVYYPGDDDLFKTVQAVLNQLSLVLPGHLWVQVELPI